MSFRMWCRAVWKEWNREEEGTIPHTWIEGNTVRWPLGINCSQALQERHTPTDRWRKFPLKKVKITSGKKRSLWIRLCIDNNKTLFENALQLL